MADTITLRCPNCDGALMLPAAAAGKRIKCKHCSEAITVPESSAKPMAAKPVVMKPVAAKPKPVAPPPPPPPPPPANENTFKLKEDDDDEDETNPNPYGMIKEVDVPRCPHCATELDPPDTKVCLNCGYDLTTRTKHKTKKVYETTGQDKFQYWLPAFVWIVVLLVLIIFTIACWVNMEDWMTGGFLDKEEKHPGTLKTTFYVGPDCFNVNMTILLFVFGWFGVRTIVHRLILKPNPDEVEKVIDDEEEEEDYDDDDEEDEDEEDDDDDDDEEEERPKKKNRK
jgi:ribosomal protein S27E